MVYGLHSETSSTHPGYFSLSGLSAGEVWPRNISSALRGGLSTNRFTDEVSGLETMKRINTLHSCCRERTELREEEKDDINSLFKEKTENQKKPDSEDNGLPAITALSLSSGRIWMLSSYISSQINLRRVQDAQLCSFLNLIKALKQQKQDQSDLKHNVQVGLQRRWSRR